MKEYSRQSPQSAWVWPSIIGRSFFVNAKVYDLAKEREKRARKPVHTEASKGLGRQWASTLLISGTILSGLMIARHAERVLDYLKK